MKGDSDKDRLLTQSRAMVIRDYLVHNFKLDDKRLKTIGLGKSPEVNEGSRVDVIVYSSLEKAPARPARASRSDTKAAR